MTTHVFIVDAGTFRYHLEYLFAGTGAKDFVIDFNDAQNSDLGYQGENLLLSMIADVQRIRKKDKIIFYLQQSFSNKIAEGKFFGIFEAKEDWAFLDNNDGKQFLVKELGKSLTFRTLISPLNVYPHGVTEWEALDEIKNIQSPQQMLWSLIYRKLKGHRGNTMITDYEAERLFQLIRNKNERSTLSHAGKNLSFDKERQEIITVEGATKKYTGGTEDIKILKRLIQKREENKSYETHLQAYVTKNIGTARNKSLDNCLVGDAKIEWLGNEVSCGVGMQRIDVMLSTVSKKIPILIPIELKSTDAEAKNITQIQRYIDWINQYYIPNKPSDIQPVLLTKKSANPQGKKWLKLLENIEEFNRKNKNECYPLKLVTHSIVNGDLFFETTPSSFSLS